MFSRDMAHIFLHTIFDLSDLTYPYPTHGIDKNRKTTHVADTWLYRRSRNAVIIKTFGTDIITTSHTTSNFNVMDINVLGRDSLMGTHT